MRLLVDTDVVLDLLLDRPQFGDAAVRLFAHVERGEVAAYVCATTVTTIHYLATKAVGRARSRRLLERLLSLVEVAPVNRVVLDRALESKVADFEDSVVCQSALQVSADAVVTRNLGDYRKAPLPVHRPSDMLKLLEARETPGPGRASPGR